MPGTALRVLHSLFPSLDAWRGSLGGRVHLSPFLSLHLSFICPRARACAHAWHGARVSFVSLCLPSFVSRRLLAWMPGTALWVDGLTCLPLSPFICHLSPFVLPLGCLPFSLILDAWHGSLGGRVRLSPFVSLHMSHVVSQPECLVRLSGWTGSFVSLCLASGLSHLSPLFVSRCLPPWHSSLGGRISFVSVCLASGWTNSFVFHCLPAWMSGTALICLPLSLHLSPVVFQPGCLARLFGWTD